MPAYISALCFPSALWADALKAHRAYAAKPSAHRLFQVFNTLCSSREVWHAAGTAGTADRLYQSPLQMLDLAIAAGDLAAVDLVDRSLSLLGNPDERGTLRFVLAARALLVHGKLALADTLITLGRWSDGEAERLTLDLLLFRVRCRVEDNGNDWLFAKLVNEGAVFASLAAVDYLRHRWRYEGPSTHLLEEFLGIARQLPQSDSLRTECLALAFRLNEDAIVRKLLEERPAQQENYAAVLPLAVFLRENGVPAHLYNVQSEILRLSHLHDRILEHSTSLKERLADTRRSLAIVGNSPCELGHGLGAIIDGHDDVARFNFFSQEEEFAEDYGRKFTIHVRGPTNNPELHRRSRKADFTVIALMDFVFVHRNWRPFVDLDEEGVKLAAYPAGFHRALQGKLHAEPSLGLAFCAYAKQLRGALPRKDCFGFSFIDQIGASPSSAHYFEQAAPALTHRWDRELEIFSRLTSR